MLPLSDRYNQGNMSRTERSIQIHAFCGKDPSFSIGSQLAVANFY